MYAWGYLRKDIMISAPHSKQKTGFKNSKRRPQADVMTHDVTLSVTVEKAWSLMT